MSIENTKTRADFIRDIKSGSIALETTFNYCYQNETLPERLTGIRKVSKVQTNGFYLMNDKTQRASWFDFPKASLMNYTDNSLTIYMAGYRSPNEHEKAILSEWENIASSQEYKKQSEIDLLTDGSSTYWKKKSFFENRNALYLMGLDSQRGLKLDFNKLNSGDSDFIRDESIKGDIAFIYRVIKLS